MPANTATIIGPDDHGRTMTLDEFEHAECQEGRLYELGRGVVAVIDVPNYPHMMAVRELKRQLHRYDDAHPGVLHMIATGSECKVLVDALDSERHPDLALYLTTPRNRGAAMWSQWIPELVIEVVSPSSRRRDYGEKPDEYREFGVKEYGIVDLDREVVVVLQRARGRWKRTEVEPPATWSESPLPDFTLETKPVFAAARSAEST